MEFVKLYTEVLTHPKWLALSDRAKALLIQAWMYAGRAETAGYVPEAAKRVIGWSAAADRELEGSWWHRNGAGWVLHDWDHHQLDAEEVRVRRERRQANERDRSRRYRERRRKEGQP